MVQFQDPHEGRGLKATQQEQAPFQQILKQILNRRIPRSDSPTGEKGSDNNDWSDDEEAKISSLQNPKAGSSNLKHVGDVSRIPKDTKHQLSTHKQSKDEKPSIIKTKDEPLSIKHHCKKFPELLQNPEVLITFIRQLLRILIQEINGQNEKEKEDPFHLLANKQVSI